jgi:hypothetical protein
VELLFGIAILVAIGAVVAKKVRTGPRTKEDTTPRVVMSYRDVDDTLPRKCGCGGRFEKTGEGPKRVDGADCLRVVVECEKCERRRAFLFRVAS